MKVRTNVNLDEELKEKGKKKAKELNMSFSQILETLIRRFLKKIK